MRTSENAFLALYSQATLARGEVFRPNLNFIPDGYSFADTRRAFQTRLDRPRPVPHIDFRSRAALVLALPVDVAWHVARDLDMRYADIRTVLCHDKARDVSIVRTYKKDAGGVWSVDDEQAFDTMIPYAEDLEIEEASDLRFLVLVDRKLGRSLTWLLSVVARTLGRNVYTAPAANMVVDLVADEDGAVFR